MKVQRSRKTEKGESTMVKHHLESLGITDVRVGHSGSGRLEIQAVTTRPADCSCGRHPARGIVPADLVPYCDPCFKVWNAAYGQIKTEAKARTGRTGEYDGYIQVKVVLR